MPVEKKLLELSTQSPLIVEINLDYAAVTPKKKAG